MTDEVQDQNSSSVRRIDLLRAIGGESDIGILNLALSKIRRRLAELSAGVEEDEGGSRRGRNHDGPLNKDTLSLVCFCVAIIVLGLVLRKLFLYAAHVRESRRRYRGGLRQLAEHMNVVMETMSPEGEGGGAASAEGARRPRPDGPKPRFTELEMSCLRPPPNVVRLDQDINCLTTQREARRSTDMQRLK